MIDLLQTIDLSTTYLGLKLKNPLVASASPMSLAFVLRDEAGTDLAEIRPAPLLRAPHMTVYAPLPLEVIALAYATSLVLWRQAVTA